jgi:hypothetical protein
MEQDPINSWLDKVAELQHAAEAAPSGVNVIQRKHKPVNQGNVIIDLADKIRPILLKMFEGARDENEQLVQQAHVRGMSLNLAQHIVKKYNTN